MFRHCLKLPIFILRKPIRQPVGLSRLYRTSSLVNQNKSQDDKKECPKDRSGRGFYYTIGAIVVGTGAAVALAKHDDDFRAWLRENVPGSDEFISFITAEQTSQIDYIMRWLNDIFDSISGDVLSLFGKKGGGGDGSALPPCDEEQKPYIPPKPAYKPLVDVKPEPEKYTEKRLSEKIDGAVTIIPVDKTIRKATEVIGEAVEKVTSPLNLVDLEAAIGVAAQEAIKAYTSAVCILRDHADEVYKLVEDSVENVDSKIWKQIKAKGQERERLLNIAEKKAQEATESVKKMKKSMEDPSLPGGEEIRNQAILNIQRIIQAIEDAKKSFQEERARVAVTDKYWNKVQEARRHFAEELETLFPNVRLSEKNMKLADGEIDLFILYAFQNILYYQKELTKIDTVSKLKLKQILEQNKVDDKAALQCAVETEMEKEKRKIGLEFQKRMLTLRAECERDMRLQLKRQAEAHQDHLVEALSLKEKEIERKLQRKMDEQLLEEKNKYKMELATVVGKLKGFDEAISRRAGQDKKAQQSQILWSACQSLEASLRNVSSVIPVEEQLKPLQFEVDAIKNASAPNDEFVETVLSTIPVDALVRGVYTEAVLRDRFLRVEKVAHRVALLPEGGASIPVMLISYLQSIFVFNPANPIPAYELANEPFEPSKFDTFDILQRARYWLDRGDIAQCLRYMNLLQGAPRAVAKEWMNEARILLETQQAAIALMAHASATGLVYS